MAVVSIPEIRSAAWVAAARGYIQSRVDVDPTGCWIPRLKPEPWGYVRSSFQRKRWYLHRLAHEAWVGPITEGLTIDHLCRVPACCNPSHLEAVTNWENTLRSRNPMAAKAKATHCKRGHRFTEENTRRRGRLRECWECHRLRGRGILVTPYHADEHADEHAAFYTTPTGRTS